MISKEPLNFHMMIRQGITWNNLETEMETVLTKICFTFQINEYGMLTTARMQLLAWFLQVQTPGRGGRCRSENHIYAG